MAGNWKMYKTPAETTAYLEKFIPVVAAVTRREIVICPPYIDVPAAVGSTRGTAIRIGGQNLYWKKEGPVTGEVSAPMLRAAGCTHVIVAHSERRQFFAETDEMVFQKTVAALEGDLIPIVCVGECLEERESGKTESVLVEQFRKGIGGLSSDQFSRIVIAYEPVWAIGTGRTATPQIAAEAHRVIREQARSRFGEELADRVRILYGGSVKPENTKSLMDQQEIDGVLVGGASLDPASFASIVNF